MRWLVLVACAGCGFQSGASALNVGDGGGGSDAPRGSDGKRFDDAPKMVIDAKVYEDAAKHDAAPDAAPAHVGFVQGASGATDNRTNVTTTMAAHQTGGDLDVIAVSWVGNVHVMNVADSDGNTYSEVGNMLVLDGVGQLAIYVASNVRQGASDDTITVTFDNNTNPILVAAEYEGLATTDPVDQMASAAAKNSGTASSGTLTTAHAHDILVGIGAASVSLSTGTGYTSEVNATLDLIEDQQVTTTGTYSATETLAMNGNWLMALVAFVAE
jgi:hypothetical protein